ncbi:hypothetical protein K1719_034866 [Acacia pycnantha]|nr:hypothetical protein K1719_034866 [Acacia pycnantha]
MSAIEAEKNVEEEKEVVRRGELLFCGGTCWDIIGRRKGPVTATCSLQLGFAPLVGIDIRNKIVKAGAGRSHTVVVTKDGHSLAFGWNKHGQLGHGTDNEVNSVGVEVLEFIADFGKPTAPLPAAMGPRIDGTKIHDEETGLFNAVLQMALPINYKCLDWSRERSVIAFEVD